MTTAAGDSAILSAQADFGPTPANPQGQAAASAEPQQRVIKIRRDYNTWVASETLEDYALRFAPRSARRWSIGRVANTALGGAASFLVLEAVGASNFACVYLMRDSGNIAIDRAISNLPRGWQELYLQQGYDAADPVFQGVARGGTCGYWDELTRGLVLGRSSREVMDQSKNFQMREGFTKSSLRRKSGGFWIFYSRTARGATES